MRVSNSSIQTFKRCRRQWELIYKYDLKPVQTASALETGATYHDKLESILQTGDFVMDEDIKTNAMAIAFKKYILPKVAGNYEPEVWFEYQTKHGNTIVGRYDGINANSVIEHKSTSGKIDGSYWEMVSRDEQVLTYMLTSGKTRVIYTVCQKPTIRQSKNETVEQFQQRCIDWYDVDTDSKIAVNEIHHSLEEIRAFESELDKMCVEIKNCDNFYRNTAYCQHWGRMCEFAPICQYYDPNRIYVGFEKRLQINGN